MNNLESQRGMLDYYNRQRKELELKLAHDIEMLEQEVLVEIHTLNRLNENEMIKTPAPRRNSNR